VNVRPDGIDLRPTGVPVLLRVSASTSSAWWHCSQPQWPATGAGAMIARDTS